MTTTTTRPACTRCGLYDDALIHNATANGHDFAATTTRTDYACPSWCERTDHDADQVGPNDPPIHYGPDFGTAGVQGREGHLEAVVYVGDDASYVSDPDELRRAAADMIRAAEWIEGQR